MKRTKNIIILLSITIFCNVCFDQNNKSLSEPERNFETFWHFFNENYAFFLEKGMDWERVYEQNRFKVDSNTTEEELIDIFIDMVDPLKDGHIYIFKDKDLKYHREHKSKFEKEFYNDSLIEQFWLVSNETLMTNNFDSIIGVGQKLGNEHALYFSQSGKLGYIRISRFFVNVENLFDSGDKTSDKEELIRLIDGIMLNYMQYKKGLIIDIRCNGGGHGGFELASRFVNTETPVYLKTERKDGKYSDLETILIEPIKSYNFNKPIIVITNDNTASAAEDFALGVGCMDNIQLIGTNTNGSLSDTYDKELTKGLWFTLSNQKYYNRDTVLLEGIGVAVDYKVINTREELNNEVDSVILKSIKLLNGRI